MSVRLSVHHVWRGDGRGGGRGERKEGARGMGDFTDGMRGWGLFPSNTGSPS